MWRRLSLSTLRGGEFAAAEFWATDEQVKALAGVLNFVNVGAGVCVNVIDVEDPGPEAGESQHGHRRPGACRPDTRPASRG